MQQRGPSRRIGRRKIRPEGRDRLPERLDQRRDRPERTLFTARKSREGGRCRAESQNQQTGCDAVEQCSRVAARFVHIRGIDRRQRLLNGATAAPQEFLPCPRTRQSRPGQGIPSPWVVAARKQRARLCCRLHTGSCLSRPASLSFLAPQHNGAVLHILRRARVLRRVSEQTTRDPCAQRSVPAFTPRFGPSIATAALLAACALEDPFQSSQARCPGSGCGQRRYICLSVRAFRVDPGHRTTVPANSQAVAG